MYKQTFLKYFIKNYNKLIKNMHVVLFEKPRNLTKISDKEIAPSNPLLWGPYRDTNEGTRVQGSSVDERSKNHAKQQSPGPEVQLHWICNQGVRYVARCDPRENLKGLGRTLCMGAEDGRLGKEAGSDQEKRFCVKKRGRGKG